MRADLYELPFDQFQRYKTVHDFVGFIRPEIGRPVKVLDVGGYPGLVLDFLPDDKVTVVDVIPADIPNYVQASGAKLPFDDGSFDLVCSCDALEHVPQAERTSFIAELARVSGRYVLLTAPFADERTHMAEEILFNYVWKVLRAEFTTLKEHLDNGLPDYDQTIEWFKDVQIDTAGFHSGYLYHWLPMMVVKHHLMAHPDTEQLHRRVDLFYNLNFSADDHCEPSYRRVIIGAKGAGGRQADFCDRFQVAADGAAGTPDATKLEMFRMLTDLLDVELTRNVSELVDQLRGSVNDELTAARKTLADRDRQIADLRSIIRAQNDSLDELHALVTRVRNFFPYRVYAGLVKRRRQP